MNTSVGETLLTEGAAKLQLKIDRICIEQNRKDAPRYFHADVIDAKQPSVKWRMKVVNPARSDVQNCNSYNNRVHARLTKASALTSLVRIPRYFDLSTEFLRQYNLSELICGGSPSTNDLELLVEVLVNLQLNRTDIVRQLKEPNTSIPSEMRRDYRERVDKSLEGLANSVNCHQIVSAFADRFPQSIPDDILTFAHGDFSFGNLKLAGTTIALIDFEHSHIGLGCVDMAHLYVNLIADGNAKAATILRDLYKTRMVKQDLWFEDNVFEALVIERVTGKMNSMKDCTGRNFKRLKDLLSSYS